MSDYRDYDHRGRPPVGLEYSYDLDSAQHFLADHAADVIVVFDHHAANPDVSIYVETPDGTLSAGDYYLWPLLHQTATRIIVPGARRDRTGHRADAHQTVFGDPEAPLARRRRSGHLHTQNTNNRGILRT